MQVMQVAFQNENIFEKKAPDATRLVQNFGLGEAGLNFRNTQTGFKTHKSENENYSNRRIYSPYLSPSSGVVENIVEMTNSIDRSICIMSRVRNILEFQSQPNQRSI